MNASGSNEAGHRPAISRYRASTEPGPIMSHPRALMPGTLPPTIHTADLFFANPSSPSPRPPIPPHPYGNPIHIRSSPPPVPPLPHDIGVHRIATVPPPVPPKPPLRRPFLSVSASTVFPHTSGWDPDVPKSALTPTLVTPTLNSEPSSINASRPTTTQYNTSATQSHPPPIPTTPEIDTPSPDQDEEGLTIALALSQSEARLERKLREKLSSQEEEDLARALRESMLIRPPSSSIQSSSSSPTPPASGNTTNSRFKLEGNELPAIVEPFNNDPIASDEALALRLALEEAASFTPTSPTPSSPSFLLHDIPNDVRPAPSSPIISSSAASARLPTYTDTVRSPIASESSSKARSLTSDSIAGRSVSSSPHRSQISEASQSHATTDSRAPSTASPSNVIFDSNVSNATASTQSLPAVRQYIDKELFRGVSIGFNAPPISTGLITSLEVMPNIISLPYGKSPPLHLQGPTWRHLLMLMARLSGTRMEATLEAVAVNKTEMKLRTVIQFVKPLRTSSEWRTILYFTLDYPPPRDTRPSVNTLPYSYSLSSIPTLLRDAADTPISKLYTIPATDSVPYPTLPITFPDLALYLQAALEESRRYMNDSSSSNRKLAKMLQTCYPGREEDGLQDPADSYHRSGVGGLIKRVMGRSNKPTTRTGGNEDTYELITPFVSDEWG